MKSIVILLAIFAASSAEDINLNEVCRGTLFGTLPHPTNRNQFIGCVQGRGTILGCHNEDDVFDPVRVSCVDEDSLPTIPTPPVDDICEGIDFGLLAVEEDCELHVLCDGGRATVRRCPANSVFNPNVQSCVPGDLESCADFDTTTERPVDTTETTTEEITGETTKEPTDETTVDPDATTTTNVPGTTLPGSTPILFNCERDGSGFVPNVDNCNRYFECIRGVRHPRQCSDDEIFDVITRQCGPPETSLCGRYLTCG